MNKKLIIAGTLVLTICFLVLGVVFKKTADGFQGSKGKQAETQEFSCRYSYIDRRG